MKPLLSYLLEPGINELEIVPSNIKMLVNLRIQKCIIDAENHFNKTFDFPNITYSLFTTTAGQSNYAYWTLNFNPILLMENLEEFIDSTVPHEMAHLIHDKMNWWLNFKKTLGFKYIPHNTEWQNIMKILGAQPRTHHRYDVSTIINSANDIKNRNT